MLDEQEDVFYDLTVTNENYRMPAMPAGTEEGILRGMYLLKPGSKHKHRVQLMGCGTILREVLAAAEILESDYQIAADVWSVTSSVNLYRDGHACDRWNRLHPTEAPRVPYVAQMTKDAPGVFVAASDYLKTLPDAIDRWLPRPLQSLGTDGFGRSDSREALRNFFEVDARFIVLATLHALMQDNQIEPKVVAQAIKDLGIDAEKSNPAVS